MKEIENLYKTAKQIYDKGENPAQLLRDTSVACLLLTNKYPIRAYGTCAGKSYAIHETGANKSRPFTPDLIIRDQKEYADTWDRAFGSIDHDNHRLTLSEAAATRLLYTTIITFAICFDLYKPKSRKTPGTYFEIILGTILSLLIPEACRTKHITLPNPHGSAEDDDESDEPGNSSTRVSTDIVMNFGNDLGIIIPAKITTRERIVQPFAHQRILDNAFGARRYISLISCVSETQRDDKKESVNEICVPGTIRLFQNHLAQIDGLYYLDPPARYLSMSTEEVINVGTIGSLVTGELDDIIKRLKTYQSA